MDIPLLQPPIDWLLYGYARTLSGLQVASPWDVARVNARRIGDMGYWLDRPSRRRMALTNLQRAFPDWPPDRARAVLRGVYRHLSESLLDSLKFAEAARRGRSRSLVETEGFERLADRDRDTGVIFVTGHFGHWEVLGAAAACIGYPVWSQARRLRNAGLARHVEALRRLTGQRTIAQRGSLRKAIRLLQRGDNIAILVDQDVRHGGIFVDFMGRPASTTPAPARLAIYTGAPVAFVHARRIPEQNRFRVVLSDLIAPAQRDDRESEVLRITERFTRELERLIRESPEQWLWLHRRWKTYPGKYTGRAGGRQARRRTPQHARRYP